MKAKLGIVLGVAALLTVLSQAQRLQMERPQRFAARGIRGALAAGSDSAADSGMRLFYAGGNAVDAGLASMFAASVTEYSHFGFGGEAPILIRTKEGKVVSIAGVGTMPKLEAEQTKIQRKKRRFRRNDGKLGPKEKAIIKQDQDKASEHIYKEKHDAQTR